MFELMWSRVDRVGHVLKSDRSIVSCRGGSTGLVVGTQLEPQAVTSIQRRVIEMSKRGYIKSTQHTDQNVKYLMDNSFY